MSTIMGYFCTNSSLTSEVIENIRDDFTEPEDSSAMGFAWVKEGRTLTRKQPTKPGQDISALSLMSDIPSRSLVGYIETEDRTPETGQFQPFGYRRWVWAQDDNFPETETFIQALRRDIPDYIERNIKGNSPAEILFHRFMALLHANDGSTSRTFRGQTAAETAGELYEELTDLEEIDELPEMQFTAASDRLLVAANFGGSPLYYRLIEGLQKEVKEPLFSGHAPKKREYPHFKAFFTSNRIEPKTSEWSELQSGEVLWVDNDWELKTIQIKSDSSGSD